jgi:hypothetical protein
VIDPCATEQADLHGTNGVGKPIDGSKNRQRAGTDARPPHE